MGNERDRKRGKILDLGCGKGGDLQKWSKAGVWDYVGLGMYSSLSHLLKSETDEEDHTDIASTSISQALDRYKQLRSPSSFNASFSTLDFTSTPLHLSHLPPPALDPHFPFDVVSMQFCMHYAFESEQMVRCMLDNVARYLRVGGVFIGTVPNSELLLYVLLVFLGGVLL